MKAARTVVVLAVGWLLGWFSAFRLAPTAIGGHPWGPWGPPYQALRHDSTSRTYPPSPSWDAPVWQERHCRCGNREFRVAP